jgi:YVTN family beta-propeller protein
VTNQKEDAVYIFDAATNRLLQTVPVEKGPNQISFTRAFAYIRSAGTEQVKMIRLGAVAKGEPADLSRFPGGQSAPERSSGVAFADVIVPTPEPNSVLVANPAVRWTSTSLAHMADQPWNPSPKPNVAYETRADHNLDRHSQLTMGFF